MGVSRDLSRRDTRTSGSKERDPDIESILNQLDAALFTETQPGEESRPAIEDSLDGAIGDRRSVSTRRPAAKMFGRAESRCVARHWTSQRKRLDAAARMEKNDILSRSSLIPTWPRQ